MPPHAEEEAASAGVPRGAVNTEEGNSAGDSSLSDCRYLKVLSLVEMRRGEHLKVQLWRFLRWGESWRDVA